MKLTYTCIQHNLGFLPGHLDRPLESVDIIGSPTVQGKKRALDTAWTELGQKVGDKKNPTSQRD